MMDNQYLIEYLTDATALACGLYLCATPIGNMGDITLRVLRTLSLCDVIFCEDTRNSRILLDRYGIKKPLESCHEHNEEAAATRIISLIEQKKAIAYISDAGMPGISDPGERLIRACINAKAPYYVLPGASASQAAAITSGISTERLYFTGFLPRDNKHRALLLAELRRVTATIIIYESPYRVAATLSELASVFGDRRAALVRELTKLHEQSIQGNLLELSKLYSGAAPRGECALVIEGALSNPSTESVEGVDAMLTRLLKSGMSVKDAAKQTALMLDIPRNEAYTRASEIKATL